MAEKVAECHCEAVEMEARHCRAAEEESAAAKRRLDALEKVNDQFEILLLKQETKVE